MKTKNECIEYLQKRITNNQNMIEVIYFNSIIEHLKNSDRFEMIKNAYFGNKLSNDDDIKEYIDLFNDDLFPLPQKEIDRLLGNIKCQ